MHWSEAKDKLRMWREDNERRSLEVVDLWDSCLQGKIHKLGDERLIVWEQVCVAALDCNRMDVVDICLVSLVTEFPTSLRVRKLQAMKFEAMEMYDEALDLLNSIIKRDETNSAPRKRKIAILKAKGQIAEAIRETNDYLRKFMSDQEAWQELCELYLQEQEYARAAFCMEELILHNPHNHLVHQRYADIRYTQGGVENLELARAHYCLALKLNPNNMRALYGLLLAATNISLSKKKEKKESTELISWAMNRISERYQEAAVESQGKVDAIKGMLSSLQLSGTTSAPQ